LLHKAQEYPQRGDYIQVKLLDRGPILNARGRLKEVYPNLLEVDPVGLISLATESSQKTNDRAMSPTAMFASFYKDATGETLTDEQMSEFRSIIERVDQDEREAS
jgi:exonuclease SbcD